MRRQKKKKNIAGEPDVNTRDKKVYYNWFTDRDLTRDPKTANNILQ